MLTKDESAVASTRAGAPARSGSMWLAARHAETIAAAAKTRMGESLKHAHAKPPGEAREALAA